MTSAKAGGMACEPLIIIVSGRCVLLGQPNPGSLLGKAGDLAMIIRKAGH